MFLYDLFSSDPTTTTLSLLLQTNSVISRVIESELLEQEDITFPQFQILWILRHHDRPLTPTELRHYIFRKSQTVTVTINNLEKNGYVKRVADQKDKRVVRIEITEKAKQLVERSHQLIMPIMNEMVSCFSKDELQQLGTYLIRLRNCSMQLIGITLVKPIPGLFYEDRWRYPIDIVSQERLDNPEP